MIKCEFNCSACNWYFNIFLCNFTVNNTLLYSINIIRIIGRLLSFTDNDFKSMVHIGKLHQIFLANSDADKEESREGDRFRSLHYVPLDTITRSPRQFHILSIHHVRNISSLRNINFENVCFISNNIETWFYGMR